ncbi:MipA/OmpV family protein [Paraglaciecola sp.]|uniref:MipA/OmpV family protein n=1 Tax=Paraglaciecola sp. TaxID=1920173 RepID=UPI0030F4AF49
MSYNITRHIQYFASLLTLATLPIATGYAKEQNNGFFIAGPALSPEYQGSDDYGIVPMIVSQFNVANIDFEVEGLATRAAFYDKGPVRVGATMEVDFGRDEEVENPIIAKFSEIDLAFNVGVYSAYELPNQFLQDDNLELRLSIFSDVSGAHDGQYATFSATYTLPLYIPWRFEFELETSYANSSYMSTYFGVNELNSAQSGLPYYEASGSLRDVTLSANIGLFLNPTWGAFLRLGYKELLGDAKDSPIVIHGDSSQYFAGLGVFYRFGG